MSKRGLAQGCQLKLLYSTVDPNLPAILSPVGYGIILPYGPTV